MVSDDLIYKKPKDRGFKSRTSHLMFRNSLHLYLLNQLPLMILRDIGKYCHYQKVYYVNGINWVMDTKTILVGASIVLCMAVLLNSSLNITNVFAFSWSNFFGSWSTSSSQTNTQTCTSTSGSSTSGACNLNNNQIQTN